MLSFPAPASPLASFSSHVAGAPFCPPSRTPTRNTAPSSSVPTNHPRKAGGRHRFDQRSWGSGWGREGGLASQSVKGHRSKCNIFLSRLINTVCLHGLEKSTAHSPLIPVVICSIKCDNGRAPWLFPRPLGPARPGGPAEGCVRVIASPRGPASHHAARRISPSPPPPSPRPRRLRTRLRFSRRTTRLSPLCAPRPRPERVRAVGAERCARPGCHEFSRRSQPPFVP